MSRILFRLAGFSLGLSLIITGHAFSKPPVPTSPIAQAVARGMYKKRVKYLTQKSFVIDVLRNGSVEPADYLTQFNQAKEIYNQLQNPLPGTQFDKAQRDTLSQQIDQLTLVEENTRQLWKGVLEHRKSPEARADMAIYLHDYFGFSIYNNVVSLTETPLTNDPLIQHLKEFYCDFAERFTTFVEGKHRLPLDINGEEAILYREYEIFRFVNKYHRFAPLEEYIQEVERAAESVK